MVMHGVLSRGGLLLQERIEELDGHLSKMKREVKKHKDKEAAVSTELDETKHDLGRSQWHVTAEIHRNNVSTCHTYNRFYANISRNFEVQVKFCFDKIHSRLIFTGPVIWV